MKNEKQIKIDGYKCIKLDEWKAEKVKYVIGKLDIKILLFLIFEYFCPPGVNGRQGIVFLFQSKQCPPLFCTASLRFT